MALGIIEKMGLQKQARTLQAEIMAGDLGIMAKLAKQKAWREVMLKLQADAAPVEPQPEPMPPIGGGSYNNRNTKLTAGGLYSKNPALNPDNRMMGQRTVPVIDFQGNLVIGDRKIYEDEMAAIVYPFLKGENVGNDIDVCHFITMAIAQHAVPKVVARLEKKWKMDNAIELAQRYANSAEGATYQKLLVDQSKFNAEQPEPQPVENPLFTQYKAGKFNDLPADQFRAKIVEVADAGLEFELVKNGVVSWIDANPSLIVETTEAA